MLIVSQDHTKYRGPTIFRSKGWLEGSPRSVRGMPLKAELFRHLHLLIATKILTTYLIEPSSSSLCYKLHTYEILVLKLASRD